MASFRFLARAVVALATVTIFGCGDNLPKDEYSAACGNAVVDLGEDCDDGNQIDDSDCDRDCRFPCGNGRLEPGERCDVAIASGEGACPTVCDDGIACTIDVLTGQGCQAACETSAITEFANGDGCCPPGADDVTDMDCPPPCGNGTVDLGETCDVGIASGNGSCPTSCSDGFVCTVDVLQNGGTCAASCSFTPITMPASGDMCCPAGANNNNDADCPVQCGNGAVETGEVCDTGIAAGLGSCPTSCSDGRSCTSDVLTDAGTCNATCSFPPIETPINGDGCCPAGENPGTDNDCLPACGNGIVDPGETCDTQIIVGPGRCPTMCFDNNPCTSDVLVNGDTCIASCSFPAITMPASGDQCCPVGANNNNDSDCTPVCGNTVIEMGEQCDDGNDIPDDACNMCRLTQALPTAFRISDLDLRDPHIFVNFLGCRDVTDTALVGFSFNSSLQTSVQTDGSDPDTALDLSIATVFRPLDQGAMTSMLEIHSPSCSAPLAATTCTRLPAGFPSVATTASNLAMGTCLAPFPGTVRPYAPAISIPRGPCYSTAATNMTINVLDTPLELVDVRFAATYVGNPATNTVDGLLMGFLSQAEADSTILPATIPFIGGQPLSSLFPGGTNNCAPHNDRDVNNGVPGWWLYFNYTAPRVSWLDN